MGAEMGATTSAFPYHPDNMGKYLRATGRGEVADGADWAMKKGYLSADEGVEYDEVIDIVSSTILYCVLANNRTWKLITPGLNRMAELVTTGTNYQRSIHT